ncbi:MAG: FkbM family methyltransferase [Caulobacter sp.]|nr:FkbM family methyltransferase [Caulobacter sp.]
MSLTFRQRADWLAHVFKASTQQHHRQLVPLFAPHIPRDAVVIDIGAHAGQFSRLFATMAPQGQVWSFEPSAYARSVMETAARFRRLDNITLMPFGLSDAPGETVLHTPIKKAGGMGFGAAHLGEGDTSRPTVPQTVVLTTLDTVVRDRGIERVDFIKADIEGWELHALRGGEETLGRFTPVLYLEVNDNHLRRAGDSAEGMFSWLEARNYEAFTVPALQPRPVATEHGNFLFVPKGRSVALR